MIAEEAINFCTEYLKGMLSDTDREFLETAKQALERQIPMKPKHYIAFDGIERNGCPACVKNEILYMGQKYCSVCGQVIDWSKE